jgi:hypothetical protein
MSLVTLLPRIESDASSMPQWAQLEHSAIGPRACARTTSACKSALINDINLA